MSTQKEVRTQRLVITDASDKEVAVVTAADKGAGLWITGPDGQVVAIYSIEGQTAIGIYDKPGSKKSMDVALCIGKDGPQIQVTFADGTAHWIGLEALAKHLESIH